MSLGAQRPEFRSREIKNNNEWNECKLDVEGVKMGVFNYIAQGCSISQDRQEA